MLLMKMNHKSTTLTLSSRVSSIFILPLISTTYTFKYNRTVQSCSNHRAFLIIKKIKRLNRCATKSTLPHRRKLCRSWPTCAPTRSWCELYWTQLCPGKPCSSCNWRPCTNTSLWATTAFSLGCWSAFRRYPQFISWTSYRWKYIF